MTSNAPIPSLIAALVTAARTIPNLDVSDSYSTLNTGWDGEARVMLAVGVDDPDRPFRAQSATSTATAVTVGGARPGFDESVEVVCHLHAEAGTVDAAIPREAVYAARDALRDLLAAHRPIAPALAIPGGWRVFLSGERLFQAQFEAGASADLFLTISCTART